MGDSIRHGGIGLGLYLCKLLAEIMSGTVGFESQEGEGSTFWLKLPNNVDNISNTSTNNNNTSHKNVSETIKMEV